jgi:beta-N-acetylhexosaminidase
LKHHSFPFAPLALLALVPACLLLGGCASMAPAPPAPAPAPGPAVDSLALAAESLGAAEAAPPRHRVALPPPARNPVRLSALSLREKAAQLVMPWIAGDYWATDAAAMDSARRLASVDGVGGFIVSTAASPYDVAEKLNALQRAARIPLLIASDLEAGLASRVRGGTAFPGNMALGATDRELDAYEVGRVAAIEGRAIGIHLDFAPVVDVNNNPLNPIINVRSFGEAPARVAALGTAFIRGLREHGMLSTAKHFPGHGDTETDSHIALPVLAGGLARLDSVELVPFRAAVAAGTDAVMAGHLAVPGLAGPNPLPASLSPVVLDTLLRDSLGFRGLVVTDALNMGAIVSRYGAARAAVMAFEAGADLLLMPVNVEETIDSLLAAVARGEVSAARLDSSVARVLAAKTRLGLFAQRLVDVDRVAAEVGTASHAALAQDISQRSLVLVKDSLGLAPLPPSRRHRVLVIAYGDENSGAVGATFVAAVRSAMDTLRTFRLWPASGPASLDSARAAAAGADAVVFLAASRPTAWHPDAVDIPTPVAELVNGLAAGGTPVIAVSLGSPYVLSQIPAVATYVTAWSDTDPIEFALARALLGLAPITGRLPVSLPPAYPAGTGLQRSGPEEAAPTAPSPSPGP